MDFTDLLDWVADQLGLAIPGNVVAYLKHVAPWGPHQARWLEFRALFSDSRERIVREWFDAIEPAEPKFTPWYGPWPTDGF